MISTHAVLIILFVYVLGAISPGPSFLVVTRAAVGVSRQSGIWTAVGISIGTMLSAAAGLWGLTAVLANAEWLGALIRIVGGSYLLWLGVSSWRGAASPLEGQLSSSDRIGRSHFQIGLLTEVSNPKTLAFFASLFASANVAVLSTGASLVTLVAIGVISVCWYSLAAVAISSGPVRALYQSFKILIDRITGVVLVVLGGALILSLT